MVWTSSTNTAWAVDRRARASRCAPVPGAPRATPPLGASALPCGPGSASRPARARRDRGGQPIGVVEAAHAAAQRMRGHRDEHGGWRQQPGGAPATICAAIASATPSAPRNFSAWTSARAGPSKATGAHAWATAEPSDEQRRPHGAGRPQRGQRAPAGTAAVPGRPSTAAGRRRPPRRTPSTPVGRARPHRAGEQRGRTGQRRTVVSTADGRATRVTPPPTIETILRSGCGHFVDVRPGRPGTHRPGDRGLRPALAPRARHTARARPPSAGWWPSPAAC